MKTLPKIGFNKGLVDLSHGAGGRAMTQLIEQLFFACFDNDILACGQDYALLPHSDKPLVMATDSYVVSPLFFPGGNIGDLAINGTLNDIAMSGAKPLYLSVGFILEEGFALRDLKKIVESMACGAKAAGVKIVTGDTKVVEKGSGDGVFINTTGVGELAPNICLPKPLKKGDKIIINGEIGTHGTAILSSRENLSFATAIESDSANLYPMLSTLEDFLPQLRCLRDPTRGGVAAVMNEWAHQFGASFLLDESALPMGRAVQSACELMGLDPLNLANEGKVLMVCEAKAANEVVASLKTHPLGHDAAIIGEVIDEPHPRVLLTSCVGGVRLVDWIAGEQLPRIC